MLSGLLMWKHGHTTKEMQSIRDDYVYEILTAPFDYFFYAALFHIYMGEGIPEDEKAKRLKAVRKHLCQKLGDMQRK